MDEERKLKKAFYIFVLLLFFLVFFNLCLLFSITKKQNAEIENAVNYLILKIDYLEQEQKRQARQIEQDLFIFNNGYEVGKN